MTAVQSGKHARSRGVSSAAEEELTPLELAQQRIAQLPQSTQFLDLSEMGLPAFPEEVFRLTHLRALYLNDNDLETLPDHLFHGLPDLTYLDLRNNRIVALPKGTREAQRLRTLLLGNNRITALPTELGDIQTLCGLNIAGNPLFFPPDDITHQGVHAIKAFLRARTASLIADPAFMTNPEIEHTSPEPEPQPSDDGDVAMSNPFAWQEDERPLPTTASKSTVHTQEHSSVGHVQQQHSSTNASATGSDGGDGDVLLWRARSRRGLGADGDDTESVSSALANKMVTTVLDRLALEEAE
ncbi:hypothetical protein PTSG_03585 [Salpingoeca rosetta]|uniref:Uncharacterized protein n=1 Tax=Salpingoeca rosetta (strain ATCC 50818 / BSB-021) TaxID=946362 RepID=F2U609_SALR5|nr:uncharacterized protein PTSG_03585 [Salpingoeca rosetta]EGD82950.1 hypothetical protein PTSG_03585 [Salpingoeca rosetta]|eukprot:XP_004995314.1 hypothetical protein PTSG_03585 [Salpingoeca rosetta]